MDQDTTTDVAALSAELMEKRRRLQDWRLQHIHLRPDEVHSLNREILKGEQFLRSFRATDT